MPATARDGAYVINLDDYGKAGTHWVACFISTASKATYFDSFGVEHLPKEVKKILKTIKPTVRQINKNIYRIQDYNSVMCGYFCIGFIDYMLNGKTLHDFTNLFSPNNFKQNDKKIKNIFNI